MPSPLHLFVSLMISIVGLAVFIYGKRQRRLPQLVAGVLWMVFPYFVSSLWALLAIGLGIGVLGWLAIRIGL